MDSLLASPEAQYLYLFNAHSKLSPSLVWPGEYSLLLLQIVCRLTYILIGSFLPIPAVLMTMPRAYAHQVFLLINVCAETVLTGHGER
jgi:hypothetical protein